MGKNGRPPKRLDKVIKFLKETRSEEADQVFKRLESRHAVQASRQHASALKRRKLTDAELEMQQLHLLVAYLKEGQPRRKTKQ